MVKFFKFSQVVALALMLVLVASEGLAQRRARQDRAGGTLLGGPQLGRRGDRQPPRNQQRLRRQRLQQQLMQAIGLTDSQRTRMADIRRSYDEELAGAGRRLRQARQALNRAIMSERFDEALVNQRTEELAAAQAEMIRLQSRVRAQVRNVLTTEQVIRFHQIERQLRRNVRGQRRSQEEKVQEQERTPPEEDGDFLSLLPTTSRERR